MARTTAQLLQMAIDHVKLMNDVEGSNKDSSKLNGIDIAAIRAIIKSDWSYQIWDRVSPINGVPASEVLAKRTDIPANGDVYLVLNQGAVVIFQPHSPDDEGHVAMTGGTASAFASKHMDDLIDHNTINHIISSI